MSKVWGGVGAWALDAERAEAEEREAAAEFLAGQPAQSFPSLKEAAAAKPKKKKGVTVTLSQFVTSPAATTGLQRWGLAHDELFRLPTGPKERSAEELEHGRLGGGFRSYGSRAGSGGEGGSWGGPAGGGGRRSYGGFDDDSRERPPPRASDFDQPSRADEVDNWAAGKKSSFTPNPMDSARHDRYSSLGSSGSSSKADEVNNWAAAKKPLPSRYPSFGSGFRDSSHSDSDRWVHGGGEGGERGLLPSSGERPRLLLDPPKMDAGAPGEPARTRPSPFGAARPREEILKEKGIDWVKMEAELEKKTSRPSSSQSSRPSSAQSSRPGSPGVAVAEGAPKPRPKVNPFGEAKPREVKLQEQGLDWRKLDLELEHRRVNRPEAGEEKLLKEEINNLKVLAKVAEENLNKDAAQFSAGDVTSLRDQILHKENELRVLACQLDDKIRFVQKSTSDIRPIFGAGRTGMSMDRPPSQSGMSEESRSMEFMDWPQSRGGIGDVWSQPMDDIHGFRGGKERGFLGDRNMDRSRSRPGW